MRNLTNFVYKVERLESGLRSVKKDIELGERDDAIYSVKIAMEILEDMQAMLNTEVQD